VLDWLYVKDHCRAVCRVLEARCTGETYDVGGCVRKPNIETVKKV
jgi:dTDP-glucose 4,6-dehydratase